MSETETVVRYRIDARQSRFHVHAEASGLLSVFGHNPVIAVCGFGGDVRCAPRTLEGASLLLLVQANSLAVTGDVSEKDRAEIERVMRAEVLETSRYTEIVFMSTSVSAERLAEGQFRARISGNLSLHGVTREKTISAHVAANAERLRAQGEFGLRQSDFQIRQVNALGGTLKVKDELRLTFDISANADFGLRNAD
jgi:polyisoprenoid-binding protein YceI